MNIDWKKIWDILNQWVLNKYVLTLIIFGVILLFVGEQSVIKDLRRHRQINQTEQAIQEADQAIQKAQHQLQMLNHKDSLERFAREEYYMHNTNEDVYMVDEEDE